MRSDSVRAVGPKTDQELAHEWDDIARRRHEQIESGLDLSFHHVLAPLALDLLEDCDLTRLLDAGCGTGELTALVARQAGSVTAVDPSSRSVEIASGLRSGRNTEWLVGTLEELIPELASRDFSSGLAAMTLMTVPDLGRFAKGLAAVLANGAQLVTTMIHPCFWPRYWGYESEAWFSYEREVFIEAPFRITKDVIQNVTTHIHRPLAMYLQVFAEAGFALDAIEEPKPPPGLDPDYLSGWHYPRFLGVRWKRTTE